MKGADQAAIAQYQKALEIQPRHAEARFNLGNVLLQQGKVDEAIAQYRQALEIKPDDLGALNNLAWLLATAPAPSLRNGAEAVALATKAGQLSGGANPAVLRTLAAAYAEAGRFDQATATARKALAEAQAQSNDSLAGALREQIQLYEAGLPMRQTY
jgi:Flp pilus assembly protein TadD